MSNFNNKDQFDKDQYEIEDESNSSRKWNEDIGEEDLNSENTTFVLEEEPDSHVIEVGSAGKKPMSKTAKTIISVALGVVAIGAAAIFLPNGTNEATENNSSNDKKEDALNLEDGQIEEQKQEEVKTTNNTEEVKQEQKEFVEQKVEEIKPMNVEQTEITLEQQNQEPPKEEVVVAQEVKVAENKQEEPSLFEQTKNKLQEVKETVVEKTQDTVQNVKETVQDVKEAVVEKVEDFKKPTKEEITPFVEQNKVKVQEELAQAVGMVEDKVKIVHGNTLDNRRLLLEMQKEIDSLRAQVKELEVKQSEGLPCSCTNEAVKDNKVPSIVKDKAPVKNIAKPKERKGNFVQLVGKRKTPELKDISGNVGSTTVDTNRSNGGENASLIEKHEVKIQSILNGIVWVNDSTGKTHTYTVGDKLGGRVIGNIDENSGVFDVNGKKILDIR